MLAFVMSNKILLICDKYTETLMKKLYTFFDQNYVGFHADNVDFREDFAPILAC